mmetsp:Transcript_24602/g.74085  ORF Transcript_24602/g.74085 Transcript_24602/m.74085 type:complete len:84 (-) Transcript_24602:14-265(-)
MGPDFKTTPLVMKISCAHRLLAKFPSEARSRHDDLCPMDEGGRLFINQCNLSELGTVVTRLEVKREAKKNARVVQRKLARLIS